MPYTKEDLVWLAAAIDCDGYIGTHKIKRGIMVTVGFVNTSKLLMDNVIRIFREITRNKLSIYLHSTTGKNKVCHRAVIQKQLDVVKVLSKIIPYLLEKKKRTTMLREYLIGRILRDDKIDIEEETKLLSMIRELNDLGENCDKMGGGD